MQQIADWLEKLGMSEYAQRFAENEIDFASYADLTDQDLKEIGVAYSDIGANCSARLPTSTRSRKAASKPAPLVVAAAAPQDTAERRQVTVMFSDLVGSTALSARMDPEDLREVISAYQKCVAETVGRFGGFVAKYMGDGVLVYFGYPQAHEDDAERAVRAGLELIASGRRAEGRSSASNPRWHCDRLSRGRRSDRDRVRRRSKRLSGETPNLRSPSAGHRRAEHRGHRREHAKASRQSVRTGGPWGQGPQGHRRAGAGVGGAAAGVRLKAASRRCMRAA